MSCGINHTLVLSSDGLTLWAFGDGDYGKLGIGPCTVKCYPQVPSISLVYFLKLDLRFLKYSMAVCGLSLAGCLVFLLDDRKWRFSATRESKRSDVELTSRSFWLKMDTCTHSAKVEPRNDLHVNAFLDLLMRQDLISSYAICFHRAPDRSARLYAEES